MCLYAVSGIFKATQDIKVFKVINKKGVSPHQNFKYVAGKVNRLPKGQSLKLKRNSFYHDRGGRTVDQGFHACLSYAAAKKIRNVNEIIVRGVIPKGSEVILGEKGQIVASALMLPVEAFGIGFLKLRRTDAY